MLPVILLKFWTKFQPQNSPETVPEQPLNCSAKTGLFWTRYQHVCYPTLGLICATCRSVSDLIFLPKIILIQTLRYPKVFPKIPNENQTKRSSLNLHVLAQFRVPHGVGAANCRGGLGMIFNVTRSSELCLDTNGG